MIYRHLREALGHAVADDELEAMLARLPHDQRALMTARYGLETGVPLKRHDLLGDFPGFEFFHGKAMDALRKMIEGLVPLISYCEEGHSLIQHREPRCPLCRALLELADLREAAIIRQTHKKNA